VSTVGTIVVIPTSSSISFTQSVQLEIYIFQSESSILEKTSAMYQIDFEFKYFNPDKLSIIFLFSKVQI
jgi:hypothetical protein